MPQTIQFHLGEDVDGAVCRWLRLRGIDVATTQEAGLLTVSDNWL